MDDPVKPALTPLDWANLREGHEKPLRRLGVSIWRGGVQLQGNSEAPGYIEIEHEDDLHALAALCLYQQPFGFSQADLEMLGKVIDWIEGDLSEPHPELRSLASRIASLLPQEGK